jgi:hypothetical protein
MAKYNIEIAISISFVLGLILPLVGLGGMLSLLIMGFVATYLTRTEQTSYKVGGIATGVFCIVFFFIGFFTPPDMPYILPSPLSLGILVALSGILNIVFGLIVSLVIYGGLGLLGGLIAEKFFLQKKEKKTEIVQKKQHRSLKRV